MTAPGPEIRQIVDGLTDRIEALCRELLPGGRVQGREFVAGSLAGEPGGSLSVCIKGDRAGVWADFAGDNRMRGDALDLVAQALYGGDKAEARKWAIRWLGLDSGAGPAPRPVQRRAAPVKDAGRAAAEDEGKRARKAFALWLAAKPGPGTPAAEYLAHRGLDLARLGAWPSSLRFHPGLYEGQETRAAWPAMVAPIVGGDGSVRGIHRTFLKRYPGTRMDETGHWGKAPMDRPKKMLGPCQGGCIRLWRGERIDPETGEVKRGRRVPELAPGEGELVLVEGIEDGLAIILADPSRRVWSFCSISWLAGVKIPEGIGRVILARQNDPQGSEADEAFDRAAGQLAERVETRVMRPPEGLKDWADWYTHKEKEKAT